MQCNSCGRLEIVEPAPVADVGFVTPLRCPTCKKCIAWSSIEEVLTDSMSRSGWFHVATARDRLVHFTLSQIVYREHEVPEPLHDEAIFEIPDPQDIAVLLWVDGRAAGFYTIKPKGTAVEGSLEQYNMHTLDTAYVCLAHRRQGHGTALLHHIISSYPSEDIGLSKPISHSMWKVLEKFLRENPNLRDKLWEVEGTGHEGDRKLIWYSLKKRKV